MLTTLTNLTRSATQTLLTNGTRSLAPVVDGNMLQARAVRSRHVVHPQVGCFKPAGITPAPIDPERIRIDRPDAIPGSPLGGDWPLLGRSQAPSPWSSCPSGVEVRSVGRSGVVGRRVSWAGSVAGLPVAAAYAAAPAATAAARAHAPDKAGAAPKRPAATGG